MINPSPEDKRLLIFGRLFTISNRLQLLMDRVMDELTAKQWFVLTILELFEEPPSLIELATACDSSYQNIKQLTIKLQEKGFVTLEDNPKDKRAKRVMTTSKISEWKNANKKQAAEFIDTMFVPLSSQQIIELSGMLEDMYEKLGEMKNEKEK